jgi:hypothetical protein
MSQIGLLVNTPASRASLEGLSFCLTRFPLRPWDDAAVLAKLDPNASMSRVGLIRANGLGGRPYRPYVLAGLTGEENISDNQWTAWDCAQKGGVRAKAELQQPRPPDWQLQLVDGLLARRRLLRHESRSGTRVGMSALGQKQTSRHVRVMSVIPLKVDIRHHEVARPLCANSGRSVDSSLIHVDRSTCRLPQRLTGR